MTLDQAITHAREVAEKQRKVIDNCEYKSQYECKGCADYYSKPCIECAEEHEQLAEWLEELKELGEKNETLKALYEDVRKEGNNLLKRERNKAIDDLQNELKNHYTEYIIDCVLADTGFYSYTTACNYLEDYIDKIAEKLKRGGENESSN